MMGPGRHMNWKYNLQAQACKIIDLKAWRITHEVCSKRWLDSCISENDGILRLLNSRPVIPVEGQYS